MNLINRKIRAKARIKTMNLRRTGVPCTASKWGWMSNWRSSPPGLTPSEVQSVRKTARFEPAIVATLSNVAGLVDQFADGDYSLNHYVGAF